METLKKNYKILVGVAAGALVTFGLYKAYQWKRAPVLRRQQVRVLLNSLEDFCRETMIRSQEIGNNELQPIRDNKAGNKIQVFLNELKARQAQQFQQSPNDENFIEVRTEFLDILVSNLKFLHQFEQDFIVQSAPPESKYFFGAYFPFQNQLHGAYDGPAQGPMCAVQTLMDYQAITNLVFTHENKKLVNLELLRELVVLLGARRILTCQDSGGDRQGTRRLIPLMFALALVEEKEGLVRFVEQLGGDNDEYKSVLEESLKEKTSEEKLELAKKLPGYYAAVQVKIGKVKEPAKTKLNGIFK